jgi:hypothetical protein
MRLVSLPESGLDVNPPAWTDATATAATIELASQRRASIEATKRIAATLLREGFGAAIARSAMVDFDRLCGVQIGHDAISAAVQAARIELGQQPGASW